MASENRFLIYALLMGIFITFLYDILRVLRRVIPHSGFLVSLEDFCFWIYCALRVFLLMYYESDGTLRWFAILGALAGMFLYKKLVSPYFVKYTSFLLQKILTFLRKILGFVFRPLIFACKKGRQGMRWVSTKAAHQKNFLLWRIKKKLTLFRKFLRIKYKQDSD